MVSKLERLPMRIGRAAACATILLSVGTALSSDSEAENNSSTPNFLEDQPLATDTHRVFLPQVSRLAPTNSLTIQYPGEGEKVSGIVRVGATGIGSKGKGFRVTVGATEIHGISTCAGNVGTETTPDTASCDTNLDSTQFPNGKTTLKTEMLNTQGEVMSAGEVIVITN